MNIFPKRTVVSDSEVTKAIRQASENLEDDRKFWDMVVSFAEPETETEARRAAMIADILLEERRRRFPR